MEMFIDDKRVDTDDAVRVAVSLSVAVVTDPGKGRAGYTRSVRLPMTPANDAVFGYAAEVHSRDGFNSVPHTGRIEWEGSTLIEGMLCLNRAERSPEGGFYEVYIIGAAKQWASRAAAHALRSTSLEWAKTLTAQTVLQSWTDSSPVRFLPVAREKTGYDYSSGGVIPAVRVLSTDDYHPFIHAATLLGAIFAESGYTVEGDFIEGGLFSSLYISGNYPVRDVSVLKENMDFFARRGAARSAVADSRGRVYADPNLAAFTVGDIVDASGGGEDEFSRGGCFQKDGTRVAFIPVSEVSVGFQYGLRYTTDFRMKSRTELAGFDRVYLGEADERRFTLSNPYPDRRGAFRAARSYTLAIFDAVVGYGYQLRYTRQPVGGGSAATVTVQTGARFSTVTVAAAASVGMPVLWYRTTDSGTWRVYSGDWALYDGFVAETGTLDVELTVRTAPEVISPGDPKFFSDVYFGGAEPGMRLTVGNKTFLRPVFYAQPTDGSSLVFADVCAHTGISQMDFIDALRQMFNLVFLTDNHERVVRVIPAGELFSESRVADRTDRIDLGRPIAVEELGGDLAREMVWRYASGDGAVARFNRSDGERFGTGRFGEWRAEIENTAADDVSVSENRMFTPSLSASGFYLTAPSARVVQVGDGFGGSSGSGFGGGSADTLDRTENLNFAPKIVRYEGMRPLPGGESWGWPSSRANYPKLAFHAPESGYTLCFEDRDGCTGLHSYRDGDVRLWNSARRVTLWLRIEPRDMEALAFPGSGFGGGSGGFDTLISITLDGETALWRLEQVLDYDPLVASTKCVLVKHIP